MILDEVLAQAGTVAWIRCRGGEDRVGAGAVALWTIAIGTQLGPIGRLCGHIPAHERSVEGNHRAPATRKTEAAGLPGYASPRSRC